MHLQMFLLALKAAIVGYTWSTVLIRPGHLLSGLWRHIEDALTHEKEVPCYVAEVPEEIKNHPDYVAPPMMYKIMQVRSLLLKPLGECELCTAGQLAMWAIVLSSVLAYLAPAACAILGILFNLVAAVCFAILMVQLFKKAGV